MQCTKCHFDMPDVARFCPECGTKAEKPQETDSLLSANDTESKNAIELKTILIGLISVGLVVLIICGVIIANKRNALQMQEQAATNKAASILSDKYGSGFFDVQVTRKDDQTFAVTCSVEKAGELFDCVGDVSFNLVDNDTEEWEINGWIASVTPHIKQNDNFYHVGLRGNSQYLFRFTSLSETLAEMDVYDYDLGMYGRENFGHETDRAALHFNSDLLCFEFTWLGDFRIYPDRLERDVGEKLCAYPYVEFVEKRPVNPEDYWWYSKAKQK